MLSNKGFACKASLHAEASLLQKHDTTKLGSNVVQELKINQRRILIDSLEIGIPAPEQMIALGERKLPNGVKVGQLLNSKTLNYKKFTPHRDGLFCERIFGPVQSFVCACGKKKESVQNKSKNKDVINTKFLPPRSLSGIDMPKVMPDGDETVPEPGVPKASLLVEQATLQTEALFCPKCQVEYISKNVRRHRLGYIKLFAPVTHIWYLKGRPSYLSLFLGKRKKAITSLAYCNAYLVEQVDSNLETDQSLNTYQNEVLVRQAYLPEHNSGYRNYVPVTETKNRQTYTNKSVTTLVGKSNVRIWDNFKNSNVLSTQVKGLSTQVEDISERNGKKQNLQITNQDVKKNLLKLLPPKSQTKLEKDKIRYLKQNEVLQFVACSTFDFDKKTSGEDINKNSVTSLYKNRCVADKDFLISTLPSNKLKYRLCTKLDAAKHFAKVALAITKFEQGKPIFKQNLENTTLFSFKKHKHNISSTPYIRAQSLPFLPSLISPFHLRDSLISFLQSLPCVEDIPIPMYCQTPRRYPLRDVHKFLAELRSTNTINKTERLSSESIARFIGSPKQTESVMAPYSKVRNLSSVLLKKENRDVIVHKPRYINFSYKNPIDAFRFVGSENKNRTTSIQSEELAKQGIRKQTLVDPQQKLRLWLPLFREQNITKRKQTPFWRARIKAPTGEDITLTTNQIKNQSKRYQQQEKFHSSKQSKTLLRNTQVEREMSLSKLALLPLSLSFVAASSSLVRDRFVSRLPLYENNAWGGFVLNVKCSQDHFVNSEQSAVKLSRSVPFLSQESQISLRGVLLNTFLDMVESKLRDLCLPLCSKSFQIGGIKAMGSMGSFNQGQEIAVKSNFSKQDVTRLGFVNGKASNQLNIEQNSRSNTLQVERVLILQNKLESSKKGIPYTYKSKKFTYIYVPTFLYAQRYRYDKNRVSISEILFRQQSPIRYKYPFCSTINISRKTSVETRSVNTKCSLICNLNKAVLTGFHKTKSHFAYKGQLKQSCVARPKCLQDSESMQKRSFCTARPFAGISFEQKAWLLVRYPKQSFGMVRQLFKKEIDTYQARLLYIVFGSFSQTVSLNQLIDSNSSFLSKLLVERSCLQKTGTCLYKTSFLNKPIKTNKETTNGFEQTKSKSNKILGDKKNPLSNLCFSYQKVPASLQNLVSGEIQSHTKASQGPRMYLLTKDQIEQKQVVKAWFWQKSKQTEEPLTSKIKLDYALLLEGGKRIKKEIPSESELKFDKLKSFKDFMVTKAASQKQSFGTAKFSKDKQLSVSVKTKRSLEEYQNEVLMHKATRIRCQQNKGSCSSCGVPPTSFGSETISKWQTNGAKEILLYTGGGALESLLKRFNTSLFCQFLFSEIQILRKHYKDQILAEHNKNSIHTVQRGALLGTRKSNLNSEFSESINRDQMLTEENVVLPISNAVLKHTLKGKERDLGLKDVVTDKGFAKTKVLHPNLFCRRIYRSTRRLKIVQLLMRSKRRPEWMMISVLPVLPPDLRPVLQMGDNLIVASDLNTLYQRVIYRNNRHYKGRFLDFHFVSSIHRLVQDAVDRLIENGKGGSTPFLTPGGRPLKSLSDILKGKRGRFRFNLLGKRVDFSGRSVIVVSPNLKIHECGLPREMALELYKYLLIRQLLLQKRVSSIVNAKRLIKQRKPLIWDILREIIYYHPLLLNRAPTLHRLGIQAFQPKLSLGNAILLHPLVCAGFNADFDGDQMGVHLPLSPQARAEAWDLLWSRNNLLSPATGQPILLPSQDMVLGFYYMTTLLPYGTTNKTSLSYELVDKNQETVKLLKVVPQMYTNLVSFNNILSQDQKSRLLNKPNAANLNVVDRIKYDQEFSEKSLVKDFSNYDPWNQNNYPPKAWLLYQNKVLVDDKNKVDLPIVYLFSNQSQVIYAYQKKQIDIHTPIWLKWPGRSENGEKSQIPLELRIDTFGHQTQIYPSHHFKNKMYKDVNTSFCFFHIRTTVGRVLVNNLISKTNS